MWVPYADPPRLFRVILPVSDIDEAAAFYTVLLGMPGIRVWSNRHYFDCAGTILAACSRRPTASTGRFAATPSTCTSASTIWRRRTSAHGRPAASS